MNALHAGIVGFGRIGLEHAKCLAQAQGIRAAAVFDPTPARRNVAQQAGLKTFDRLDDLLSDASIDAVLISTPTSLHFEQASRALEAGKHVMVEKPMTLDLAQARKLVDLASRAGRVLSVFHNRRWDADYLALRAALQQGKLGKILNVESRLGQFASCVGPATRDWRPQWRNESAWGGGALYDWGSHFVDQLWRLLWPQKPCRVFAQLRGNIWSQDCDDLARISFEFDGGAIGLVEINTTTRWPLARWHVDGMAGSVQSPPSLDFDIATWAKLDFSPADGGEATLLKPGENALTPADIWSQFAAAVRDGSPPAVSAQSVLPTMALLDAARQSSATGQSVDVQNAVDWQY